MAVHMVTGLEEDSVDSGAMVAIVDLRDILTGMGIITGTRDFTEGTDITITSLWVPPSINTL